MQGYLKKELTQEAVLPVNAQDVNVPDPPLMYTAPPCCFKNRTEKERKIDIKENENTNYERVIWKM